VVALAELLLAALDAEDGRDTPGTVADVNVQAREAGR
jgi:hypothetical protein